MITEGKIELASQAYQAKLRELGEPVYGSFKERDVLKPAIRAALEAAQPSSLMGMIAEIYRGMDADDRAFIDRQWRDYRGNELKSR